MPADRLQFSAIIAALLLVVVMAVSGPIILWVGLSIGFFNSIMFPNIFALGVDGLDKGELSMASGLINTMIVGGAVIPVLMGVLADGIGVRFCIYPAYSYVTCILYSSHLSAVSTNKEYFIRIITERPSQILF